MNEPITVDIPHKLGRDGVRARLDKGIGKLGTMFAIGSSVTGRRHFILTTTLCPPMVLALPCRMSAEVTPPARAR